MLEQSDYASKQQCDSDTESDNWEFQCIYIKDEPLDYEDYQREIDFKIENVTNKSGDGDDDDDESTTCEEQYKTAVEEPEQHEQTLRDDSPVSQAMEHVEPTHVVTQTSPLRRELPQSPSPTPQLLTTAIEDDEPTPPLVIDTQTNINTQHDSQLIKSHPEQTQSPSPPPSPQTTTQEETTPQKISFTEYKKKLHNKNSDVVLRLTEETQIDPRIEFYDRKLKNQLKKIFCIIYSYNVQQHKLNSTKTTPTPITIEIENEREMHQSIELLLNLELTRVNTSNASMAIDLLKVIKLILEDLSELQKKACSDIKLLRVIYDHLNKIKVYFVNYLPKYFLSLKLPVLLVDLLNPIRVNVIDKRIGENKETRQQNADPRLLRKLSQESAKNDSVSCKIDEKVKRKSAEEAAILASFMDSVNEVLSTKTEQLIELAQVATKPLPQAIKPQQEILLKAQEPLSQPKVKEAKPKGAPAKFKPIPSLEVPPAKLNDQDQLLQNTINELLTLAPTLLPQQHSTSIANNQIQSDIQLEMEKNMSSESLLQFLNEILKDSTGKTFENIEKDSIALKPPIVKQSSSSTSKSKSKTPLTVSPNSLLALKMEAERKHERKKRKSSTSKSPYSNSSSGRSSSSCKRSKPVRTISDTDTYAHSYSSPSIASYSSTWSYQARKHHSLPREQYDLKHVDYHSNNSISHKHHHSRRAHSREGHHHHHHHSSSSSRRKEKDNDNRMQPVKYTEERYYNTPYNIYDRDQ